jgi:hypothetical protein
MRLSSARLKLILWALLAALILTGCKTEVGDSAEIECANPVPVNWIISKTLCRHLDAMPVIITHPATLPNDHSLPVYLVLHGFGGVPAACEEFPNNPKPDRIMIYNCSDPDNNARSWWGPLGGTNDAGRRLALSINKAYELFGASIDLFAGVTCTGVSMGGGGCILQSMIMPDGLWRSGMTIDAIVPHTLIAENNYSPEQQAAWGFFPASKFDVREQMRRGSLRGTRYRLQGHTNDSLGVFDTDFFRYCDMYKIECFGLWSTLGHDHNCGLNLPCASLGRQRQAVIFTDSTGNYWGTSGHHNLGLSSYQDDTGIYVRYQRYTSIGAGVPDMPETIQVNVTVDGVTSSITLQSSEQYTKLESGK